MGLSVPSKGGQNVFHEISNILCLFSMSQVVSWSWFIFLDKVEASSEIKFRQICVQMDTGQMITSNSLVSKRKRNAER